MKKTDLERYQRELKKSMKKQDVLRRKSESAKPTKRVGEYIERFFSLFRYDSEEIFNIKSDIKILEVIEEMKIELPEKYWENILRKSIKKTNINKRDEAFNSLKELAGMNQ
jgi:hypothetical protein